MKKEKITIILNLDNVSGARCFLDGLHFGDHGRVTMITAASGKELYFKDMSDDEAIHYANELYNMQAALTWGEK